MISRVLGAVVGLSLFAWAVDPHLFQFHQDGFAVLRWALIGFVFLLLILARTPSIWSRLRPVGLLAGLLLPSVIFSGDPFQSTIEYVRLASCLALFALLYRTPRRAEAALRAAIWISCAITVSSVALYIAGTAEAFDYAPDRTRIAGVTTHPNLLALCAAISLIAAWFNVGMPLKGVLNLMARALLGGASVVCVSATDSRTGLLMIGMIPLAAVVIRIGMRLPLVQCKILSMLVIAGVSIIPIALSHPVFSLEGLETGRALSTAERFAAWREAYSIFTANPVFGQGLGREIDVGTLYSNAGSLRYAHNVFLTYSAGAGILGALGTLLLLYVTSGVSARLIRSSAAERGCAFTSILALIAFAAVDGGLQGVMLSQLLFAVFLGTGANAVTRPILQKIQPTLSLWSASKLTAR
jgi:O-antigen ligase